MIVSSSNTFLIYLPIHVLIVLQINMFLENWGFPTLDESLFPTSCSLPPFEFPLNKNVDSVLLPFFLFLITSPHVGKGQEV